MYDRILLATDGSEPARAAERHVELLAETLDATVHVITVSQDEEIAAEATTGVATRLGEHRVETVTRDGRPADTILGYADEADVDLIAVGTEGKTGLRRAVAGSVAERVVRLATVPVLSVRSGDAPEAYERVLLPTDGSTDAERAADHAIALGEAFDAAIHVISVVDVNTVAAQSELANPNVITGDLREQCEQATKRVAERVHEAGLEGHTAVLEGTPSNAILEYTADHDCDLVTMATHGRTGLERVLIGSTTERTIRRASVPVVSVGPNEE